MKHLTEYSLFTNTDACPAFFQDDQQKLNIMFDQLDHNKVIAHNCKQFAFNTARVSGTAFGLVSCGLIFGPPGMAFSIGAISCYLWRNHLRKGDESSALAWPSLRSCLQSTHSCEQS